MLLYEGEIRKSLSFLLKFSPFRKTLQSLYDLREGLLILLHENQANKNNGDFEDEVFWDFIDETLRNYKKAKEG